MKESTITVNRFWELVDGKPLELARAIIETETTDRLGEVIEVIERANTLARASLPCKFNMFLPTTDSEVRPVIIGSGFVQVTWIITHP